MMGSRPAVVAALRSIARVGTLTAMCTSCAGDGPSAEKPAASRLAVVLDYSPTLSDADALLYLASSPAVDLLAVTLPGTGEADCQSGVPATRSLLMIAGKPDVPVGCGRDTPLVGSRDWPEEWRTEVNRWGDALLPSVEPQQMVDAEQLLIDTISTAALPITIVAVAPLTNLGVVLTAHPELARRIERVVIMGGAVDVAGNVDDSPAAEWNLYIDPEAARRVINAGLRVTLVPLDATNSVPWSERLLRRLSTLDSRPARTIREMAASRDSLDGIYLWDELAAISTVRPDLVTTKQEKVSVNDAGDVVTGASGADITLATGADADGAIEEFLRTVNGGDLPPILDLSQAELDYMIQMNGADGRLGASTANAFSAVDSTGGDPREEAGAFVQRFFSAIDDYASELRGLVPPPDLSAVHNRYLALLTQILDLKSQVIDAFDDVNASTSGELLDAAEARVPLQTLFDQLRSTCQVIEDYSFLHNGPRPCSSAAGR